MQKVLVVPDEGAVQEFESAGLYPPFHDRVHVGHADDGGDDSDALAGEDCVERGRVRAVAVAIWVTHDPVGCTVAPRTRTRRLECSMAANT
jgi:hypothetical protein